MILEAMENVYNSNIGLAVSHVVNSGISHGIDGVVAGVGLGLLVFGGYVVMASRSRDGSAGAAAAYLLIGAVGLGAQYGGTLGAIYGIGKGILQQI